MLHRVLRFSLIAIVAAILGFGGLPVAGVVLSKLLLIIFMVLFVTTLAKHLTRSTS